MCEGNGSLEDRIRSLALGGVRLPTSELPALPADAPPEEQELRRAAETIILGQHDLICSQQASAAPVPGSILKPTVERVRHRWVGWEEEERPARLALAVFHGLAERCLSGEIDLPKVGFFERNLPRILEKRVNPSALENEARVFGLPVCEPAERVKDVSAYFGYVDKIEDHLARVILLDCEDKQRAGDVTVPLVWLPAAYRREGAGVAWVERQYEGGVRGRFEPASAGK